MAESVWTRPRPPPRKQPRHHVRVPEPFLNCKKQSYILYKYIYIYYDARPRFHRPTFYVFIYIYCEAIMKRDEIEAVALPHPPFN